MQNVLRTKELTDEAIAWGASDSEKGEVFTKPEIVQFMLITSGIDSSILDSRTRILEPSCGQGEFVIAIAQLLVDHINTSDTAVSVSNYFNLIKAYEISDHSIHIAKNKTVAILEDAFDVEDAWTLVESWYCHGDFLLAPHNEKFTHVIGNPPYVRVENIPPKLLGIYRACFTTMKDRADLYVAFYEKSLSLLNTGGVLSFICTDRWTKNRYGSALRALISSTYQLDLFVDLYGQNAFQTKVLTYPAITQISRNKQSTTTIIHNPTIHDEFSKQVYEALIDTKLKFDGKILRKDIVNDDKPWLFGCTDELDLIKRLEEQFPTIEEVGCQVLIGAATGNNKVYVVDGSIPLEPCRMVPMIKAADISNGVLSETKSYLINTYDSNGVINLNDYPLLQAYLREHETALRSRHIAKNSPNAWFKTIDRVYPNRARQPKLLIPDIKSELTLVYDEGRYHPNNSIYYICSTEWDLLALKAVLMSGLGQMFVQAYSTKISGGNLRFQAQHLRRIRIPTWGSVNNKMRQALSKAAVEQNIQDAKVLVSDLYGFNEKEKQLFGC
ncbi:TaqI-like C-terminal specificity domain-containing protein [Vibrio splendidus]